MASRAPGFPNPGRDGEPTVPSKRLPYREYKALAALSMTRDRWRCRFCKSRNNLHAHHVIFRSHGGEDSLANLVTVCYLHHSMIHSHKFKVEGDANGGLIVTCPTNSSVRFTI